MPFMQELQRLAEESKTGMAGFIVREDGKKVPADKAGAIGHLYIEYSLDAVSCGPDYRPGITIMAFGHREVRHVGGMAWAVERIAQKYGLKVEEFMRGHFRFNEGDKRIGILAPYSALVRADYKDCESLCEEILHTIFSPDPKPWTVQLGLIEEYPTLYS